jgi:polar amino acid transport system ATP-binding protein
MSLVEIREIDKSFGHLHVLKRVSLDFAEGEIVAIIGRSDSGKSTLLRCINGLEPLQGGRLRVDGDLVNAPKRTCAGKMTGKLEGLHQTWMGESMQPLPSL